MKQNKYSLFLISLLLILTLSFTSGVSEDISTSSVPVESSSNSPTIEVVDRYSEIIDTTLDKGFLTMRFLGLVSTGDIKSGDSTIVTFPDGKNMLIDGGSPEQVELISEHLHNMGITKLDAIMASHPHIDHIGGIAGLLESFDVDIIYRNEMEYHTKTYDGFVEAVEKSGAEVVVLSEGCVLYCDNISLDRLQKKRYYKHRMFGCL